MCACVRVCVCGCGCACACVCMWVCAGAHVCACLCMCAHVRACVCAWVRMCVHVCAWVCVGVHVCACVCVCDPGPHHGEPHIGCSNAHDLTLFFLQTVSFFHVNTIQPSTSRNPTDPMVPSTLKSPLSFTDCTPCPTGVQDPSSQAQGCLWIQSAGPSATTVSQPLFVFHNLDMFEKSRSLFGKNAP